MSKEHKSNPPSLKLRRTKEKNQPNPPKAEQVANKKDDFEGKYKRALADYQNLLKRQLKEKEEFVKYANEQIIIDFIPVYDNLRVSLDHIEAGDNPWVKGIEYVIKQFNDLLEVNGVKEIKTMGEKFDPSTMEAVEGKGEKVIKQAKAGYTLNGKVIIPAKVILE